MTESQYTQGLLKFLRERRYAIITKHCDRFTKGVPDMSLAKGRTTIWVEIKVLELSSSLCWPRDFIDNAVQLEQTMRLDGLYLVHKPSARPKTALYLAEEVHRCYFSNIEITENLFFAEGKGHEEFYSATHRLLYNKH